MNLRSLYLSWVLAAQNSPGLGGYPVAYQFLRKTGDPVTKNIPTREKQNSCENILWSMLRGRQHPGTLITSTLNIQFSSASMYLPSDYLRTSKTHSSKQKVHDRLRIEERLSVPLLPNRKGIPMMGSQL